MQSYVILVIRFLNGSAGLPLQDRPHILGFQNCILSYDPKKKLDPNLTMKGKYTLYQIKFDIIKFPLLLQNLLIQSIYS